MVQSQESVLSRAASDGTTQNAVPWRTRKTAKARLQLKCYSSPSGWGLGGSIVIGSGERRDPLRDGTAHSVRRNLRYVMRPMYADLGLALETANERQTGRVSKDCARHGVNK